MLNKSALVFSTVSDMSRYLGRNALTDTGYVKKYMNLLSYIKVVMSFITKMNLQGLLQVRVHCKHHLRTSKDLLPCASSPLGREENIPPIYIINTQGVDRSYLLNG